MRSTTDATEGGLKAWLVDCPLIDGDSLSLVASKEPISAVDLEALLSGTSITVGSPAFRFVEWTHRMQLGQEGLAVPDDPNRLVAGRWFGPRGDLQVWREGAAFRWSFVGDGGVDPPAQVPADDYFEAQGSGNGGASTATLRRGPVRSALLWKPEAGEIAQAESKTLALLGNEDRRLRLFYRPYFDRGVIAAVRYLKIGPKAEA